ncbi:uncharacterized protein LOC125047113 [Penaeus chinensis]|uniref:uncharacterized protein LOC125047113 n=1 Tax=Penaeus chinensis TaxID=139456 RepID=UPI001FB57297|nr:uncharacterized protein LOC125047113 [Penaeus chinensis]
MGAVPGRAASSGARLSRREMASGGRCRRGLEAQRGRRPRVLRNARSSCQEGSDGALPAVSDGGVASVHVPWRAERGQRECSRHFQGRVGRTSEQTQLHVRIVALHRAPGSVRHGLTRTAEGLFAVFHFQGNIFLPS